MPALADVHGPARVVDGDTLVVDGVRVRLLGVDAPEMSQNCETPHGDWACGRWARDVLYHLTGSTVSCEATGTDRYGRMIARCDAGQGDLGAALVRAGAATAYRRYSMVYVGDEAQARAERRGIWRQSGRGVVDPARYRADRRAASAPTRGSGPAGDRMATADGGCNIKGNISANGRIFHMPHQRDYARTRINEGRGERWFCTESEALSAGWRPARR